MVSAGDARISWVDLPDGAVSPLVTYGGSVWFGLSAPGSAETGIYRFAPGSGTYQEVTNVALDGVTAATATDDGVAVADTNTVALIDEGGGVTTIALPEHQPLGAAPMPGEAVRALAAQGGRLFVARYNTRAIDVIDLGSGRLLTPLTFPEGVAPPSFLQALPSGNLLASAPFAFLDLPAGAFLYDLTTNTWERLEGATPNSATVSDGEWAATQTSQTAPLVLDSDDERVTSDRLAGLTLTGAEDLIASAGGSVAVAAQGAGALEIVGTNGAIDDYQLPVFRSMRTLDPEEYALRGSEAATVETTPHIDSLTGAGDRFIVMAASLGSTRLGVVALP